MLYVVLIVRDESIPMSPSTLRSFLDEEGIRIGRPLDDIDCSPNYVCKTHGFRKMYPQLVHDLVRFPGTRISRRNVYNCFCFFLRSRKLLLIPVNSVPSSNVQVWTKRFPFLPRQDGWGCQADIDDWVFTKKALMRSDDMDSKYKRGSLAENTELFLSFKLRVPFKNVSRIISCEDECAVV